MLSKTALTLATWITISRIVLVAPICLALVNGQTVVAAVLVLIAGLTDFLDGYVARKRGEVSEIGKALDPIADKILTSCVLMTLVSVGVVSGWHLIPALLIVFRETLVSGLRESARIELPVTQLAKAKTAVQFLALVLLAYSPSALGLATLWTAALLTGITGSDYVRSWVTTLKQ